MFRKAIIFFFLCSLAWAQSLEVGPQLAPEQRPDAPGQQTCPDGSLAHMGALGRLIGACPAPHNDSMHVPALAKPPRRTNKQELRSKFFWVANGALVASYIPARNVYGEHSDRYAIPAVIGLDYLVDRYLCRWLSIAGPAYGIQHYIRDRVK